jgi:hypothetical protein
MTRKAMIAGVRRVANTELFSPKILAFAVLAVSLLIAAGAARAGSPRYVLLSGTMPQFGSPGIVVVAAAPSDSGMAPTPDRDARLPMQPASTRPQLTPTLVRATPGIAGDGYAPGSAYSNDLERRSRPATDLGSTLAPTLSLRLPLRSGTTAGYH